MPVGQTEISVSGKLQIIFPRLHANAYTPVFSGHVVIVEGVNTVHPGVGEITITKPDIQGVPVILIAYTKLTEQEIRFFIVIKGGQKIGPALLQGEIFIDSQLHTRVTVLAEPVLRTAACGTVNLPQRVLSGHLSRAGTVSNFRPRDHALCHPHFTFRRGNRGACRLRLSIFARSRGRKSDTQRQNRRVQALNNELRHCSFSQYCAFH